MLRCSRCGTALPPIGQICPACYKDVTFERLPPKMQAFETVVGGFFSLILLGIIASAFGLLWPFIGFVILIVCAACVPWRKVWSEFNLSEFKEGLKGIPPGETHQKPNPPDDLSAL